MFSRELRPPQLGAIMPTGLFRPEEAAGMRGSLVTSRASFSYKAIASWSKLQGPYNWGKMIVSINSYVEGFRPACLAAAGISPIHVDIRHPVKLLWDLI